MTNKNKQTKRNRENTVKNRWHKQKQVCSWNETLCIHYKQNTKAEIWCLCKEAEVEKVPGNYVKSFRKFNRCKKKNPWENRIKR